MSGKASQLIHGAACEPNDHGAGEPGKLCDPNTPLAGELDRLQRYLDDAVAVRNQRWADAKAAKSALRKSEGRLTELEELAQRVVTVADEAFGPFPVQTSAAAMTEIEKGIFALRTHGANAVLVPTDQFERLKAAAAKLEEIRAFAEAHGKAEGFDHGVLYPRVVLDIIGRKGS